MTAQRPTQGLHKELPARVLKRFDEAEKAWRGLVEAAQGFKEPPAEPEEAPQDD